MQKQAPSFGRVLTMALFALSCFGLLLFLWLSFGGTVPLKSKGYRMTVAMPEATQLGLEADVRIAGVTVGRVRQKDLAEQGNRTLATLEIEPQFAPIPRDSRAILRQKTLLGETYLELTPGSRKGPFVEDGGQLANVQVESAVELDEVIQALDPQTRSAFKQWQQELAKAGRGRGRDLNDALGNLPGFVSNGEDVLRVLDTQDVATKRLIQNAGVTFAALTQDEQALRDLITSSGDVFDATAAQNEALEEAIKVFPTFFDESKATLARVNEFAADTGPLMRTLKPALANLPPAVRDARAFAPDLERTFRALDPLITASRKGLPAAANIFTEAKPLLASLGPFLGELNPILQWLELHQTTVADFITNGSHALSDTTVSRSGGAGHFLRQYGPVGAESVAVYPQRHPNNRGNSYFGPLGLDPEFTQKNLIYPVFDCRNAGGEKDFSPGTGNRIGRSPACKLSKDPQAATYKRVERNDYSKP